MSFYEACKSKQPGEKCRIKCEKGYSTIGRATIKCLENLKWTVMPTCKKVFCPTPKLRASLLFQEDCTSKMLDEYCHLECREGGFFIKDNRIKCIKGFQWTSLPKCTCPIPKINKELEFKSNCTAKLPGNNCFLACKDKEILIGKHHITCDHATKWTHLPRCKKVICEIPVIPSTITFIENYSSNVPTRRLGERFFLKCVNNLELYGKNYIICQMNGRWSKVPKCKKKFCPLPNLSNDLIFQEDCSSKVVGDKCFLGCRNGGKIFHNSNIFCVNVSHWSSLPICVYPLPSLVNELNLLEDCSFKPPGHTCEIKCQNNLIIYPSDIITCQNNFQWSAFPKCEYLFCTKPILTNSSLFDEECISKKRGEQCNLICKIGSTIIGKNLIKCLRRWKWTPLPLCTCTSTDLDVSQQTTANCTLKYPEEFCFVNYRKKLSIIEKELILYLNFTKFKSEPIYLKRICPAPLLPSYLKFAEDCSSKVINEFCKLVCIYRGEMKGQSFIKCNSNMNWSKFPLCLCPMPKVNKKLKLLGDCFNKSAGEKCYLTCKPKNLYLKGRNFIVCQENSKWSALPDCVSRLCSKPNLTGTLFKLRNKCTKQAIGSKCKIHCRQGGKIIGRDEITCLNNLNWGPLPDCTCQIPNLKSNLKGNCTHVKRGQKCMLSCKGNLKLIGRKYMLCQKNTKWTSLQTNCISEKCSVPNIMDGILILKENCSSKTTGQKCKVACAQGGKMIGKAYLKCLEGNRWAKLSYCLCPEPVLGEALKTVENCKFKKANEKCFLACQGFLKLHGRNFISCQRHGMWTPFPKCLRKLCPEPFIEEELLYFEKTCPPKLPGEICKVKCKGGRKTIGVNYIKCLNDQNWSKLPDCSCLKPYFTANLIPKGKCSYEKRYSKCILECKPGFNIVGNNFITCQKNHKWSPLPNCKEKFCEVPKLVENAIELKENCSLKFSGQICKLRCKNGGKFLDSDFIICLKNRRWSLPSECTCPAPVMSPNLTIIGNNCSDTRREGKCFVKCKKKLHLKGKNYITCKSDMNWDISAKCVDYTCPKPKVPKYLTKIRNNCENKNLGEYCEVKCSNGGKVVGKLKCVHHKIWTKFPDCSCPKPILPSDTLLRMNESCENKKPGENCEVICSNHGKVLGRMTCNSKHEWIFPNCSCPKPVFASGSLLRLVNGFDCINISVGRSCKVECSNNGTVLGFMTCNEKHKWSFPDCSCPAPNMPKYLTGDCKNIRDGMDCIVKCLKGGVLIGHMKCRIRKQWSFPNCTCAEPVFSIGSLLRALNNKTLCKYTRVNETCEVYCLNYGHVLGKMICNSEHEWVFPECSCTAPNLPGYLSFSDDDCKNLINGSECKVKCTKGGNVLGLMKCRTDKQWDFPACSCGKPVFPSGSLLNVVPGNTNCKHVRVNGTCEVYCLNYGNVIGKMTCNSKHEWNFPNCSCPAPNLPEYLSFLEDDCKNLRNGEYCKIKCSKPGDLLSQMKCRINKQWDFPNCSCPKPVFKRGSLLRPRHNNTMCKHTKVGEICDVYCSNGGTVLGNMQCNGNYEWSFPDCSCPEPNIPEHLRFLEGDCKNLRDGAECKVKCSKGGIVLGNIKCRTSQQWEFPDCTCARPVFPTGSLLSVTNNKTYCKPTRINQTCDVYCLNHGKVLGNMTCNSKREWNFPECSCPAPNLPKYLTFLEGDCKNLRNGEDCKIKCTKHGDVLSQMKCVTSKQWSFPSCSCPKPVFHTSSLLRLSDNKTNCERTRILENCDVYCVNNGTVLGNMQCSVNYEWIFPDCSCPEPNLPTHLSSMDDCKSISRGAICKVNCSNGGTVIGNLKCNSKHKWDYPNCSCPKPIFSNGSLLRIAESYDCSNISVGSTCKVECSNNGSVIGYMTCNSKHEWNFPYCSCSKPIFPPGSLLRFIRGYDCSNIPIGRTCKVECSNNGTVLANLTCNKNLEWSRFPDCSCPEPKLPAYLNLVDNCKSQPRGKICKVNCSNGGNVIGNLKCNNKYEWDYPTCSCPKPIFFNDSLLRVVKGYDCNNITVGGTCKVECSNNGTVLGYMTCNSKPEWNFPYCSCSKPIFPPGSLLRFIRGYDCSNIPIGRTCKVECSNNGTVLANLTCDRKHKWSVFPACSCPKPIFPINSLLRFIEGHDCSNISLGKTCKVKCSNNGAVLGDLTCHNKHEWSFPKCSCPKPVLGSNSLFRFVKGFDCSNIPVGRTCHVVCSNNGTVMGEMTCNSKHGWNFPDCSCPAPNLPKYLKFLQGECKNLRNGGDCKVKCSHDGDVLEEMRCKISKQWDYPNCSCPNPVFPSDTLLHVTDNRTNCKYTRVNETCEVYCLNYGDVVGKLKCNSEFKWNVPYCSCPEPNLPTYLTRVDNCRSSMVGENCKVSCSNGGNVLGNMTCNIKKEWDFPKCTCPEPTPPPRLHLVGNCSNVTEGQTCEVRCLKGVVCGTMKCDKDSIWSYPDCC